MANLIDLIGRFLISALFLISAYDKIFSIDGTMSWMEGFGVPGILLYPTIVLEIILPLFVIIGYRARLAAGLLAIFCTLSHPFLTLEKSQLSTRKCMQKPKLTCTSFMYPVRCTNRLQAKHIQCVGISCLFIHRCVCVCVVSRTYPFSNRTDSAVKGCISDRKSKLESLYGGRV